MTPACASHSKTIIEENQTGITITLAAVSAGTPQIVNLFVTPQIPLDHVYVHHLRQPVRRRHAHTVQQIQQLLCWLGQRQDGECRQPVLGDLAIASGLVAGPKRFERLLKYAITDGYLVQHRLGISITGGSPIGLVDWTTLGEGLYHGLTQTLPRPTFYRQAIGRHKSADQVYLALETRDWLLRTGYVARPDDIWMLPARRHIE
ncbi:MAG: hypothetical protein KJ734_14930, partial [Chloroflexi bacterium]|nr:hypothetical protein [Chloroflexota bacterium]